MMGKKSLLLHHKAQEVPEIFFSLHVPLIYYKLHFLLLHKHTYPVLLSSGLFIWYQTVPTSSFLKMHWFRLFMTDTSRTTKHTNIQTITNLKLFKQLALGTTLRFFVCVLSSWSCIFTTKLFYNRLASSQLCTSPELYTEFWQY